MIRLYCGALLAVRYKVSCIGCKYLILTNSPVKKTGLFSDKKERTSLSSSLLSWFYYLLVTHFLANFPVNLWPRYKRPLSSGIYGLPSERHFGFTTSTLLWNLLPGSDSPFGCTAPLGFSFRIAPRSECHFGFTTPLWLSAKLRNPPPNLRVH